MSESPPQSSRRRFVLLGAVALVALATGSYFAFRPGPPAIPAVDLSQADPEVASAIESAANEVREHPRDAARWGTLGMLLRANDFDMPSVEAFAAAERFDPGDVRWPYLQGLTLVLFDPDAGIACLQRAVERAPDDFSAPRLRLAEILLERGRIAEAEALVMNERGGEKARTALILARIEAERGNWSGVLDRSESHREDPAIRKRAALLRVTALSRLDRPAEAARESIRAHELPEDELNPDRCIAEVLTFRRGGFEDLEQGTKLLMAGRPGEAIPVLERAVEASRNRVPAQVLLSRALNQTGNPASARRLLDEVFRVEPNSIEAWFQRGIADLLDGEFGQAERCFSKVVSLKSDHGLGHYQLGNARMKLGNRSGAAAAFADALRCQPDPELAQKAADALRELK